MTTEDAQKYSASGRTMLSARENSVNYTGDISTRDGKQLFGIDAEAYLKNERKRNIELEQKLCGWIEGLIGEKLEAGIYNFYDSLKSGKALCKLMNAIIPNSIPKFENKENLNAWQALANINLYLAQCKKMKFNNSDLFDAQDLVHGRCLSQVAQNIYTLAKKCEQAKAGGTVPIMDSVSASAPQIDIKAEIAREKKRSIGGRTYVSTATMNMDHTAAAKDTDEFQIEVELDLPDSPPRSPKRGSTETKPLIEADKKCCASCTII